MCTKTTLLNHLTTTKESQISLLQSFVRAPSPNPPGDTTLATRVITDYLSSNGIPHRLLTPPDRDSSPNLVAEFTGLAGPGPRVVLNGHIDVFPVDSATRHQWDRDPYSGDIENGLVHGRGVVDMKSGTASLVLAYAALYKCRHELNGSVALCAVSDEETGGKWGTQYLLNMDRERWGGDLMLSTEPSGKTIRFSEKGTLRVTGIVRTKGAHGAYLNLSKGAIRTATTFLSHLIPEIESLPLHPPPELSHYLSDPTVLAEVDRAMGLGTSNIIAKPTVNIGTITGGVKVNMIPDSCTFELDIRLPVGLVAETVMGVLEDVAGRPEFKLDEARFEFNVQDAASNPASYSSLDHPIVKHIQQNAEAPGVGNRRPIAIPSMGATDCKHYRYKGIPAFVYGCSPFTMASVNESASVDEFLHVTKVMALATLDFLTLESA
ncbi:uncharacterized protein BDV14DRAFT_207549 [Aspergillus stella-maris]|uniref:uncharacterized protein n=1 Tax=Aspergillus stella-maris TaxID=1810926 RepID=UPI003CCD008D